MPADCTGTTVPVTHADPCSDLSRAPAARSGWPDAVAADPRADFARDMEARARMEFKPFATPSWPALSEAMLVAEAAREVSIQRGVEHSVSEQFRDGDDEERNAAWVEARDTYHEALDAILTLDVTDAERLREKVVAFLAGHNVEIDDGGDLDAPWLPDELPSNVLATLWHDMRRMPPCKPIPAQQGQGDLIAPPSADTNGGASHFDRLTRAFLDAHARSRTASAAADHVAAGEEAAELAEPELVAANIAYDETLQAVANYQPRGLGEMISKYAFMQRRECYGLHDCALSTMERVQSDLKHLASLQVASGLRADLVAEFERRWACENVPGDYPDHELDRICDETGYFAHWLMRTPAKTLADFQAKARVAAWAVGDVDGLLDPGAFPLGTYGDFIRMLLGDLLGETVTVAYPSKLADRLEQQFVEKTSRYRSMQLDDDANVEEADKLMAEAWLLDEAILAMPCDGLSAIRAKARIALDRVERDGGSNWADRGDRVALEQVIAYIDTEVGPLGPESASQAPTTAAEMYEAWRSTRDAFNADPNDSCKDRDHATVTRMLHAALDAPIVSTADAVAKVRLAIESLENGELTNGKDVSAMRRLARWIESR